MAANQSPQNYIDQLPNVQIQQLVSEIKDWTIANGLAVRPPPALVAVENNPNGILAVPAPVTLVPSPFPRACFDEAIAVQTDYNKLYAHAALESWLGPIIESIRDVDEFVAKLWDVHLAVKSAGYKQVCLLRVKILAKYRGHFSWPLPF